MPGKVKKTDATPTTAKPVVRRSGKATSAVAKVEASPAPAAPAKRRRLSPAATALTAVKPVRPTARRASARRQTSGAEPIAVVADRDTATPLPVAHAVAPEPTHEEIAERAYFVYVHRNGAPGDASDDWAQAEYQLRRERGLI